MEETTLNKEFYALIEPLLKEAGYNGKLKNGAMTAWKGHTSVRIHHHPMPYNPVYELVCITFTLNHKRIGADDPMILWLTNYLSGTYGEFNFTCLRRNYIKARYVCGIREPQDMVCQLAYAAEYFSHVRRDFRQQMAQICGEDTEQELEYIETLKKNKKS